MKIYTDIGEIDADTVAIESLGVPCLNEYQIWTLFQDRWAVKESRFLTEENARKKLDEIKARKNCPYRAFAIIHIKIKPEKRAQT